MVTLITPHAFPCSAPCRATVPRVATASVSARSACDIAGPFAERRAVTKASSAACCAAARIEHPRPGGRRLAALYLLEQLEHLRVD